jgi:hypothetical protein
MNKDLILRNRKEALLRLGILVLIAVLVCVCNNQFFNKESSVPEDYRVESLKSLYPLAYAEAIKWKKDAYLNGASFWVKPQNDNHPLRASFGFERLESNEWLLIEYYQQNNKTELTKKEKGVHPLDIERPGFDINKIKSDSYEAFMLMYEAEGERLIQKYPDILYPIILYLNHFPNEKVEWVASCQTTNGVSWRIRMDAYTNQNIRVETSE